MNLSVKRLVFLAGILLGVGAAGFLLLSILAPKPSFKAKFDLICVSHGRALNLNSKKRRPPDGFFNRLTRDANFRYAVDLNERVWDMVNPPPGVAHESTSIIRIEGNEILFLEMENIYETYNYETGVYFRIEQEHGILYNVDKGYCKRVPFSGLPVDLNREPPSRNWGG